MIRLARAADSAAVTDLWNWMIEDTLATFTDQPKTLSEVAELLHVRRHAFLVHAREDDILGYAHYGAFRPGPGYAATCEHSVIVAPHAQSAGIGSGLMQALIDCARGEGLHVMVGAISGANPGAVRFHERLGFAETGRMPQVGRKAGQWLDLVLMQKILTTSDLNA